MDQAMQGEIIAIGDEITSGRILDTNSQWLSVRLEDLGIRVLFHTVVGDELQAMVAVFRQAIDRSDVVITTGGLEKLWPTPPVANWSSIPRPLNTFASSFSRGNDPCRNAIGSRRSFRREAK